MTPLKADVEDDPTWLLIEPDGTVRRDANVFITENQYRQMRQGYLCPWCFHELRSAFDRTCKGWCYGPYDASQEDWKAYMDERFGGVEWFGPSKKTLERMETDIWTPRGS
jgi:hypothetical protein